MKILFLCVANSARSQMAEGLARHLYGSQAVVASAGSEPSSLNPYAVKAMSNIGIDISRHYSKPIAEVLTNDVDLIVTLCADEVCPVVASSIQKAHWPFRDPAATKGRDTDILKSFEEIRDQIRTKLIEFGDANGLLRSNVAPSKNGLT